MSELKLDATIGATLLYEMLCAIPRAKVIDLFVLNEEDSEKVIVMEFDKNFFVFNLIEHGDDFVATAESETEAMEIFRKEIDSVGSL